jgi:hypothetical protein
VTLPAAPCTTGSLISGPENIVAGSERGVCGFGTVSATMPALYQNLKRLSVSSIFYERGFTDGGTVSAGCGECVEITRGGVTVVGLVTDFCDPSAGALCATGVTQVGPYESLSADLSFSGTDLGAYRPVPCPGAQPLRVFIDPLTQLGFLRIRVYAHRVGLALVEARGAGPGVSSTNPWTTLTRTLGNAWDLTGVDLRRGGTGIQLRVTSAQGQLLEAAPLIPLVDDTTVDLGVQFDDRRAAGTTCTWEPLRSVFTDALGNAMFGGWSAARWTSMPISASVNTASTASCRTAVCLLVTPSANFTGVILNYSGLQPVSTSRTLEFWARAANPGSLSVTPGPGCTATTIALTQTWARSTVDLAATCPPNTNLRSLMFLGSSLMQQFSLDDVRLLP